MQAEAPVRRDGRVFGVATAVIVLTIVAVWLVVRAGEPVMTAAIVSLGIIAARLVDVSIGVVRTVAIVQGHKGRAFVLAFIEVLVWVLVVSKVILTVQDHPWYAIPYALGFALGNWLGMVVEARMASGHSVVRVFTRKGDEMAAALRDQGITVTVFDGRGRDGPVQMLFIETRRRGSKRVIELARGVDPTCYHVVADIKSTSASAH
ncbi:MAG: hypothetical protein RLZZ246_535 [Planctomycetota bacterium]